MAINISATNTLLSINFYSIAKSISMIKLFSTETKKHKSDNKNIFIKLYTKYLYQNGMQKLQIKRLCEKISVKTINCRKNGFVVRAADRSLSFLFQYKLNNAVCQAPDAKYPDATERSAVKSGYFAAHQFSLSGYIISSSPSTLPQSRSGIVHFLDISVVARYSALSSAVSLGNTLLCLFRRR